jgi:hypothetical protein
VFYRTGPEILRVWEKFRSRCWRAQQTRRLFIYSLWTTLLKKRLLFRPFLNGLAKRKQFSIFCCSLFHAFFNFCGRCFFIMYVNALKIHIKSVYAITQNRIIPWRNSNPGLLFLRRMRCPLRHVTFLAKDKNVRAFIIVMSQSCKSKPFRRTSAKEKKMKRKTNRRLSIKEFDKGRRSFPVNSKRDQKCFPVNPFFVRVFRLIRFSSRPKVPGLPDGICIFKPKSPIWVNFGGCCNGRCWCM